MQALPEEAGEAKRVTLVRKLARGGHRVHLKPYGSNRALCGFEPQATVHQGRVMDYRHGWQPGEPASTYKPCRKCEWRGKPSA